MQDIENLMVSDDFKESLKKAFNLVLSWCKNEKLRLKDISDVVIMIKAALMAIEIDGCNK